MQTRYRSLFTGLVLAACVAFFSAPASAQVIGPLPAGKFSVSVGGSIETLDDVNAANTELSFGSSANYNLGVTYDQPLGTSGTLDNVMVRIGFFGRSVGEYAFPSSVEGNGAGVLQGESFNVWMFEFPLDIRYEFETDALPVNPYALAGPQIAIPRAEEDFDNILNQTAWSINLGVGTEVNLPVSGLSLMPEFRYNIGVTDAFEDNVTYRFREFSINDSPNYGGPQLMLHLYYQL